jgi:hypothetical protein
MDQPKIIRCAECGFESKIDIELGIIKSFMVEQAEMKRKCKLANDPNIIFTCPNFQEAINAVTLPSGASK